ncbi:hypothetical protein [Streptomyces avicenniae]|uniref:hypothetical protein n=1 Tax=Streptomyces avicenniae TaxID=500153 RepID=UPI00069AA03B|nr:hypothetical protein [Streptomyces avicenniae]
MRAGADLRLLRAAVLAAACATLAAAGHLSASGTSVSPWALAAGWAAAFAVAVPLAGRERRSVAAFAAFLGIGQLALHSLYTLGAGTSATTQHHGDSGPVAQARLLLCNDHALTLTDASATRIVRAAGLDPVAPASSAGAHGLLPTGGMLLAHLLAALAAGWLLRSGEAALWRLVRLAAHGPLPLRRAMVLAVSLYAGLLPDAPSPVRPARTAHHPTPATRGTPLPDTVTRRGPPVRTARLFALPA